MVFHIEIFNLLSLVRSLCWEIKIYVILKDNQVQFVAQPIFDY